MFITFLQMGLANEVLLIPLLYLLNAVDGVIYGQALTDYIAVILSTIIWKQYQNSITKRKRLRKIVRNTKFVEIDRKINK
mgnify:CR=1 FL=1